MTFSKQIQEMMWGNGKYPQQVFIPIYSDINFILTIIFYCKIDDYRSDQCIHYFYCTVR